MSGVPATPMQSRGEPKQRLSSMRKRVNASAKKPRPEQARGLDLTSIAIQPQPRQRRGQVNKAMHSKFIDDLKASQNAFLVTLARIVATAVIAGAAQITLEQLLAERPYLAFAIPIINGVPSLLVSAYIYKTQLYPGPISDNPFKWAMADYAEAAGFGLETVAEIYLKSPLWVMLLPATTATTLFALTSLGLHHYYSKALKKAQEAKARQNPQRVEKAWHQKSRTYELTLRVLLAFVTSAIEAFVKPMFADNHSELKASIISGALQVASVLIGGLVHQGIVKCMVQRCCPVKPNSQSKPGYQYSSPLRTRQSSSSTAAFRSGESADGANHREIDLGTA